MFPPPRLLPRKSNFPRTAYTVAMPIKPVLCLCFSVALLLVVSGCNQQTSDNSAAEESAIRNLDAQWSNVARAHNLDGIVSYYSEDAVLLPPNAPAATNKQSIRAAWAVFAVPNVSVSWQASKVEVAKSGDLANAIGTYTLAMTDPRGKPIADKGKFVEVWKKQPGSGWKAAADIFNSDLPAPH